MGRRINANRRSKKKTEFIIPDNPFAPSFPRSELIALCQKETADPVRTIMHMRTDRIKGLHMNQWLIKNLTALLFLIIRTGESV